MYTACDCAASVHSLLKTTAVWVDRSDGSRVMFPLGDYKLVDSKVEGVATIQTNANKLRAKLKKVNEKYSEYNVAVSRFTVL